MRPSLYRGPRAGVSQKAVLLVCLPFLVLIVAGGYWAVTSENKQATLILDNGTDVEVTVTVDGKEVAKVGAHSAKDVVIETGSRKLAAKDAAGKALEELTHEFAPTKGVSRQKQVWNLKQANLYMVYYLPYGDKTAKKEPKAIGLNESLFQVTSTWVAMLDSIPTKGVSGTYAEITGHLPIHPEWDCCKHLRALKGAPPKAPAKKEAPKGKGK